MLWMFAVGTQTIKDQIQTIQEPTIIKRTTNNSNPTKNNYLPIKVHLEKPIIKQLNKPTRTLQTKRPTKQTGKEDLTTTKHRRERNQMLMDNFFVKHIKMHNKCLFSLTAVFVDVKRRNVFSCLFGQTKDEQVQNQEILSCWTAFIFNG
jgi:hypothetical protein